MKIYAVSDKLFYDKLIALKFNLQKKKHSVVLPDFETGKISKYINKDKILFEKNIHKIKDCDALLVANFKKGKMDNFVSSLMMAFMGAAYCLKKKIYLLNNLPSEHSEEIKFLDPICLDGDLKKTLY